MHTHFIPGVGLYLYDLHLNGTLNASGPRRTTLHKVSGDIDVNSIQGTSEEQSELQLGRRAPNDNAKMLIPSSDIHIRNRFISKVGVKVTRVIICT